MSNGRSHALDAISDENVSKWLMDCDRITALQLKTHVKTFRLRPFYFNLATCERVAARLVEMSWGSHVGVAARLHRQIREALATVDEDGNLARQERDDLDLYDDDLDDRPPRMVSGLYAQRNAA